MLLWPLKTLMAGAQLAYWKYSRIFRKVFISGVVKRASIMRILWVQRPKNSKTSAASDDLDPTHGSISPWRLVMGETTLNSSYWLYLTGKTDPSAVWSALNGPKGLPQKRRNWVKPPSNDGLWLSWTATEQRSDILSDCWCAGSLSCRTSVLSDYFLSIYLWPSPWTTDVACLPGIW